MIANKRVYPTTGSLMRAYAALTDEQRIAYDKGYAELHRTGMLSVHSKAQMRAKIQHVGTVVVMHMFVPQTFHQLYDTEAFSIPVMYFWSDEDETANIEACVRYATEHEDDAEYIDLSNELFGMISRFGQTYVPTSATRDPLF